jgi:hypothetical protein
MAVRIPLRPRQSTGSLPLVGTTSEKAVDTHFVHSSSRQLTVRGASFLGHPQLIHRFSTGGLSRNGGHSHAQCMDLVADRGSDLHYYRRVDGGRGHLAGGRCRIGFRQRTTPQPCLPYLLRAPRSSTHRPATAVATPSPRPLARASRHRVVGVCFRIRRCRGGRVASASFVMVSTAGAPNNSAALQHPRQMVFIFASNFEFSAASISTTVV